MRLQVFSGASVKFVMGILTSLWWGMGPRIVALIFIETSMSGGLQASAHYFSSGRVPRIDWSA